MRFRLHHLTITILLGVGLAVVPAVASSVETTPTIEAVYPRWSPEQEGIKPTMTINFVNANGIPHGIRWTGGPAEPKCSGVPIDSSSSSWSGSCTFDQEGTYTFECTVHPVMKGTIYVNATGAIPPPPPVVATEAASSVTETGATLHGTVNPKGQKVTYHFEYGLTTSYGATAPSPAAELSASSVNEPVEDAVAGLSPGHTYHFRLVAESSSGSARGADQTFTTPGPPAASTEAAISVTETGATLQGTVSPNGHPTTYAFQYGTTTSYGQETSAQSPVEGSSGVSVSVPVTGLAAGVTYHYRLVAKNEKGLAEGADRTFTTVSGAPPKEPSGEPPAKEPSPTPTPTPTPTPMPGPISPEPELAPLGPPLREGSLKLVAARHGTSVRGSLEVSRSGAGGRLEVDLIASSASLARRKHGGKQATVGRFVRTSVPAGKVSFSVALNARGKSALHRHRKLALTVKILFTPPHGASVTVTRSVLLRA